MKQTLTAALAAAAIAASAAVNTIEIGPVSGGALRRAVSDAVATKAPGDTLVIRLTADRYEFSPATALSRALHISNHDQTNPKAVGILIENASDVILDGGGAELLFDGRMLPVALVGTSRCTLRDFSIDFPNPHITQVVIESNDTAAGTITYRPEPWVDWEVRGGTFIAKGNGWEHTPLAAIAFEEGTRRVAYRTGDINVGVWNVTVNDSGSVTAPWRDARLKPGMRLAMRSYDRPAPAIFLDTDTAAVLRRVAVRYAEGMGVLAQNCVGVTLDSCAVALRGPDDPRYFTTQADATHFSSCSGLIESTGGLYEGMMDDAINVHGTYLKVTETAGPSTVRARYMHDQSWGFAWGAPGDTVRFIASATMYSIGHSCRLADIRPADTTAVEGAREFLITLSEPLPAELTAEPLPAAGIENLTRTPRVVFARNTVRHNRARGALFSTPRRTLCEENLFDHTSGAAILLCGDCNGWYETGACRDVTIRRNTFVNALTTPYQFTEAVISIYPVIPDLAHQRHPFHSGISVTDNRFITFGTPLLYARSASGIRFLRNTLETNTDYPPYHPAGTQAVTLIACPGAVVEQPGATGTAQ